MLVLFILVLISPIQLNATSTIVPLHLWHQRIRYASQSIVWKAINQCTIPYSNNKTHDAISCTTFHLNKHHRFPYDSRDSYYTMPLHCIHFDIWVKSVTLVNGYQYYVYFIDDFSFLNSKSIALKVFTQFKYRVELQLGTKIKILSSYWGEYQALTPFLASFSLTYHVSCPYSLE